MLARTLLRQLGAEIPELLRDPDRVPRWPGKIVGSISHCDSLCIVGVADRAHFRGIGLDVEPDEPVRSGVERVVCKDRERAWLDGVFRRGAGEASEGHLQREGGRLQAFYPELRTYWSFQDVELEVDLIGERFLAKLPDGPEVRAIEGRVFRRNGWILSGVARSG